MKPTELTNQQLFDELARRLKEDRISQSNNEIMRLEEEISRLNLRLRDSERGKSQFLSNVRNEINNPLTAIIGLASSIQGISFEEKVKRLSNIIYKQASELDFQMRNIIVAAEIESGDMTISPATVDVVALFENVVEMFRYKLEERKITVQVDVAERIKFRTDPHTLQTICINLISNAIEYCGANKLVIAEVAQQGELLQIVVRDFGQGISLEVQRALFQPFKQGQTGTVKVHPGHGLGLSIVNALVAQLGGTIAMASDINAGTTVTVRVPTMAVSASDYTSYGAELLFTADQQF